MDRTKIPKTSIDSEPSCNTSQPVCMCSCFARAVVSGVAVDVTKAVGTRRHVLVSTRADFSYHRHFVAFTVAKASTLQCNTI